MSRDALFDATSGHESTIDMSKTFIAISEAGPNREASKGARDQRFWNEHGNFIDRLVDEGFVLMGGPLADEGGALLVVNADDENDVRAKLDGDPWYDQGILTLQSVKRWDIFIDKRSERAS